MTLWERPGRGGGRRTASGWRGEEVAIGGADVGGGGDAGASAQDHLAGHELAVVLAEGSGERFVAGIAGVGAGGPLPYVAEELLEASREVAGVGWRLADSRRLPEMD